MKDELFIGGDPRFLAGAYPKSSSVSYSDSPRTIPKGYESELVTTRSLGFAKLAESNVQTAVINAQVSVHRGKSGYHHRPARLNLFLRTDEWPSVGVELETEERNVDLEKMETALVSNWFHFESDGSLPAYRDDGTRTAGYELITEPLPPRYYRNPRLWAGLQNILSPWTESWKYSQTGLHVHVGLTQFQSMQKELPWLVTASDRRLFAKFLVAYLYFSVIDRTFSDRVFLRKPSTYCRPPSRMSASLYCWTQGMTGSDVIEHLLRELIRGELDSIDVSNSAYSRLCSGLNNIASVLEYYASDKPSPQTWYEDILDIDQHGLPRRFPSSEIAFLATGEIHSGHQTELNMGPAHTIEFRRGKGTLNYVSIHRMVEFTTLVVRYAAHILRSPSDPVSPAEFYRYVIANTTSGALKTLAEQQLKGE